MGEHGVPVTARGSGTGLSGAAIPVPDGILVAFDRMDQILEIGLLNWNFHQTLVGSVREFVEPAEIVAVDAVPLRQGQGVDLVGEERSHEAVEDQFVELQGR